MRLTRMQAAVTRADSMWVPDHLIGVTPRALVTPEHIGVSRLVPSLDASYEPWTALGFLSAGNRLARVRWGVGVTDISRRHPVATAHAAATLHQLSRGRAILGIGTGERENSAPYGVPLRRSVDRYEEALATIRALWNSHGQPISRDSPYFPLRDAVFAVPPYRGTRPEIWAGAHGPRMLGVAGRYADGWLPGITMSPGEYADQLRTLRDAADDFGRDPDGIVAAKWFFVATAYSKDAVDELLEAPAVKSYALCAPAEYWARHGVEHPLGPDFAGAHDILPQTLDEETALAYAKRVPTSLIRDFALAGTPAEILEQIDDWRAHGLGYPVLTNMGPLHPKIGRGVLTSLPFTQVLFGLHGFGGKRS
ncbi:LLM class flavin-dependent oxidoreductase [Nocardia takedensis]